MKLWTIKIGAVYAQVAARTVCHDSISEYVIWVDGVRISFSEPVMYVEEV